MLPLTTLEPWPIGRCKMRTCRSWPLETDVELVGLIQKLCWHRGPTRCSVAVGPDGRLGCKGQTSVTRGVERPVAQGGGLRAQRRHNLQSKDVGSTLKHRRHLNPCSTLGRPGRSSGEQARFRVLGNRVARCWWNSKIKPSQRRIWECFLKHFRDEASLEAHYSSQAKEPNGSPWFGAAANGRASDCLVTCFPKIDA